MHDPNLHSGGDDPGNKKELDSCIEDYNESGSIQQEQDQNQSIQVNWRRDSQR